MTGNSLDTQVIERRLMHLADSLEDLEQLRGQSLAQLQSDRVSRWALERGVQTCIQAVLDIASHIASVSDRTVPDDYRAGLVRLAALGVLPSGFAERIAPMAGLRNILVHEYLTVDTSVLKDVLEEGLDDFRSFVVHIRRYLDDAPEALS